MNVGPKQLLDVERLLHWAYRDELPKHELGGLTGWEQRILLGTSVDRGHPDSTFPPALGAPHPDALRIDHAVRQIGDQLLDWNVSRSILLHGLERVASSDDIGLKRLTFQTSALIIQHARMGNRPVWDMGPIRVSRVNGGNGKPVVQYLDDDDQLVEGRTKGRHYGRFARCPLRYEPTPQEIVFARAEYLMWRLGLDHVADTICAWNLSDYRPTRPQAPHAPWIADTEKKSRILRSIPHPTTVR